MKPAVLAVTIADVNGKSAENATVKQNHINFAQWIRSGLSRIVAAPVKEKTKKKRSLQSSSRFGCS